MGFLGPDSRCWRVIYETGNKISYSAENTKKFAKREFKRASNALALEKTAGLLKRKIFKSRRALEKWRELRERRRVVDGGAGCNPAYEGSIPSVASKPSVPPVFIIDDSDKFLKKQLEEKVFYQGTSPDSYAMYLFYIGRQLERNADQLKRFTDIYEQEVKVKRTREER